MPERLKSPAKGTYNAYGIWLYKNNSAEIKTLNRQLNPNTHGDRLWDSAYLLMDYFTQHPLKKNNKILDIGCGWGPASIFMAKQSHKVTAVDIDAQVFEYLKLQTALNQVKIKTLQSNMDKLSKKELSGYDIIIGADICFWPELIKSWISLLKRAQRAGVNKLVLADPGRTTFLKLVDQCDKYWKSEIKTWYALEPKKFEGSLLIVDLCSNRKLKS
jgi:predicted nicotinamide N-methyase